MMDLGKIFKQKLEQQNFDASNKHWLELEKRLDNAMPVKKNNRKFLWFLFPVLAVMVLYFYSKPSINSYVKTHNNVTKQIVTQATISNLKSNSIETKSESIIPKNIETIDLKITPKSQNTNEKTAEKSLATTETIIENKNIKSAKESIIKDNSIVSGSAISHSKLKSKSTNNKTIIASKNINTEKENVTKQVELAYNDDENLLAIGSNSKHENSISSSLISVTIPQIKLLNELDKPSIAPTNTNVSQSVTTTEDYSKSSNPKTGFSVAVYAGAMYVGKKIISANNAHSDYINRRITEEKKTTTATFGADINYTYKHLIFTTGVNYHTQSENRNYSNKFYKELNVDDPYWEKTTSNYWQQSTHTFTTTHVTTQLTNSTDTVNYFDVTNGNYTTGNVTTQNVVVTGTQTITHTTKDSLLISKEDSIQKTKTIKKTAYIIDENQKNLSGKNTISYIEIPVMIGYQIQYRKIGIAIKSGIGFGLLSQQKTYYLGKDVSSITEMKTENFNTIVYNYLLRLSLNYNITKNWGIVFEPNFRTNLNSVTKKNSDFQQKYWNVGGNAGLMYRF